MKRIGNRFCAADWSVADPTSPELAEAMHATRYEPEALTPRQRWLVLEAAEAWRHFGAYGTEGAHRATGMVVRQLRAVRRAVRAAR